jgi:aryl-alcohol dehydrogenase-like predicted oxidoreductase
MEHRKIGSLSVTVAGLGCNNFGWRIDAKATEAVVNAALDAGINFFDTADFYGAGQSEEFLGRALGARRADVIIGTKFGLKMGEGLEGAKPGYIRSACEASLRRLGADYIDLYQLHKPDPNTPLDDTIATMEELKRQGKVREIGCSNFTLELLRQANGRFASVQNEYSLINTEAEAEILPECERQGIAFLPYFPLANGLLTGKYRGGKKPEGSRATDGFGPKVFTEENIELADSLADYAESRGHSLLELAFAYLLARKSIASVIAGAKTPEQVWANAKAATWRLTEAEVKDTRLVLESRKTRASVKTGA